MELAYHIVMPLNELMTMDMWHPSACLHVAGYSTKGIHAAAASYSAVKM